MLRLYFGARTNEGSISPSSFDGQLPEDEVTRLCHCRTVNSLLLVLSRWCVEHEGCYCDFSENGFIVKTNRSIVWLGGLLLGTFVVGFIRKNVSLGDWGDRKFNFFLGAHWMC